MKKVISICLTTVILYSLNSCRHAADTTSYIKYVQDKENGLRKNVVAVNSEYTFQYKPDDYIILMESNGVLKNYDVKGRKKTLAGTVWFNITFKISDVNISPLRYQLRSADEYNERFNYFLNKANHMISVVYDNKDTLRQIAYEFENNFNLTPQETMVVGFELPKGESKPQKDMKIMYTDNIYNTGIVKAVFKKDDISNIPDLIIN